MFVPRRDAALSSVRAVWCEAGRVKTALGGHFTSLRGLARIRKGPDVRMKDPVGRAQVPCSRERSAYPRCVEEIGVAWFRDASAAEWDALAASPMQRHAWMHACAEHLACPADLRTVVVGGAGGPRAMAPLVARAVCRTSNCSARASSASLAIWSTRMSRPRARWRAPSCSSARP